MSEVMARWASDLGMECFEPDIDYGGKACMSLIDYPSSYDLEDVWVRGDAVLAVLARIESLTAEVEQLKAALKEKIV